MIFYIRIAAKVNEQFANFCVSLASRKKKGGLIPNVQIFHIGPQFDHLLYDDGPIVSSRIIQWGFFVDI